MVESDHSDIDPVFGKMDDFDQLLKEAHRKGKTEAFLNGIDLLEVGYAFV